jgi:CO/xanthine dehydrogenase FAD-binding subunit
MTRVARYAKAASWREALALSRAEADARWLAGGTFLLAGDGADKPESVIDIGAALPRGIERSENYIAIGAGATFQEIAEASRIASGSAPSDGSCPVPASLGDAALSMVNRNTRNRATIGGNLGADKSCSNLIPILLALSSEIEAASPEAQKPERLGLERWLAERDSGARRADLLLRLFVPLGEGTHAAYRRWNRVSCDLSVLGAAAAFELREGRVSGIRIALGGLGPKSRRRPELEELFEGRLLPGREEIERAAAPLLKPIADLRAGADFKRLRGAQLLAEAILEARPTISRGGKS